MALISAASLVPSLGVTDAQALALLAVAPLCDVAVYHLSYETSGGAGEATTASGALMVPVGIDGICLGARPILLYAHGTSTDRDYDIADLLVQKNSEGIALAAFFASQGYIVVAPNYAGYDTSTLPYHPFLDAMQQSGEMIDVLSAARSALPVADAPLTYDGGRLFVTGYSEGGYVAMATQRAMQAAGMPVTASAPMSGPYAVAAFVDSVFAGEVNGGAPISATLLVTGYQKSYADIYVNAADVFSAQYAGDIQSLLPSTETRAALYAAGELPATALFDAVAPAPQYADMTPATSPANLAVVFAQGFGAEPLVQNSYRVAYLLDAAANPDGGWPTVTTRVAAAAPGLPLRQALVRNDLRNWVPTAPLMLCGGDSDPEVYWFNTTLMQGYWVSRAPGATSFSVLDIDAGADASGPFSALQTGFAVAKAALALSAVAGGATDGGASAVLSAYHAELVAPFCIAAVASFFSAQ
jgi:dienelactone hydrolase